LSHNYTTTLKIDVLLITNRVHYYYFQLGLCSSVCIRQELCDQIGLSVSLSNCRIIAKVISQFHWNLTLWLGLQIRSTG